MKHTKHRNTRQALSALALMAAGLYTAQAPAAEITVGGTCTLLNAVFSANFDYSEGGCTAGTAGADTIVIPPNTPVVLTQPTNFLGNGLGEIRTPITIEGNGNTISRSTAQGIPAFRLVTIRSGGNLTLNNVVITGFLADDPNFNSGGAIDVFAGGTLTLNRSTLRGNTASSSGGAIASSGTVNVNDSTLSSNIAAFGGAIFQGSGAVTTVRNSTFSSNNSRSHGGAVEAGAGTLTVSNSTVSGNRAGSAQTGLQGDAVGQGGGFEVSAGVIFSLSNSLVSGNQAVGLGGSSAGVAQEMRCGGSLGNFTTLTSAHNVIGHSGIPVFQFSPLMPSAVSSGCTFSATDRRATADGNNPTPLESILDTTLADNGGPTQTHALVDVSPAVNAADAGATEADQRGFVMGGRDTLRDIGAYELDGVPPPPPAMEVDGACGEADGDATSMAPTGADLCITGTATAVTGINGAWGWMCEGSNGGDDDTCSAPYANQTITLVANPTEILVGETSTVVASSTSGLLPVVTSTTTGVCSIQPSAGQSLTTTVIATGVNAGTCTVLANHPGTGDNGTARFLAATQQLEDITVTAAPVVGGSACDAFAKGENVNVIDLRTSPGGQTARGVNGKFNVIYGSGMADTLTGGNAGNCIDGGAGNDRLTAGAGSNSLYGGDGNDTLTPGSGSTAMDGGEGTDRCARTSGRATATRTSCELN